MTTIGSPLLWSVFAALVVVALLVDLVLMRHGGPHKVTFKEALFWSIGWVGLALAFNAWLWWYVTGQAGAEAGNRVGLEFLTGYLVEKSLAVDNIFVFLMVFTFFSVPEEQRQKVLIIGVLGAIVLRAIMIFAGAFLLAKFHWILYVFGAFLLLTGIKMWRGADEESDLEDNPALKILRKVMPVSKHFDGERFWTVQNGARIATPLLLVVTLVGFTDVIFAVDSIPAIYAITADPFIVLTSNIFAILGLRAMFFLLAAMAAKFHLLNYGLAVILVFIGTKMLIIDLYKIPVLVSLGVVIGILAITMIWSVKTAPKIGPSKTVSR